MARRPCGEAIQGLHEVHATQTQSDGKNVLF